MKKRKTTAPAQGGSSITCDDDGTSHNSLTQSIALLKGQRLRLVTYLIDHSGVFVGRLSADTAIGNVSDVAIKANRILEAYGLRIVARRPRKKHLNRFGEPTDQHQWWLERIR